MKKLLVAALLALSFNSVGANPTEAITLERMPPELETRFALSALPPALRDDASVFLLDPAKGHVLSKQGTSGIECMVERTAWELADFRDDIYVPLCYDAAGAVTYLRVIKDVAALRAQGADPSEVKAEIERRWRDGTYTVPQKGGLSYMVAPIMRTVGPPDLQVRTMNMPHLMFYAPYVTNADIGARPDLADPASLMNPFILHEGLPAQGYMIQLIGEAEKKAILKTEKNLIEDLCEYRDVLCVTHAAH